MSQFDQIIDRVLAHEGGYVNDPRDPGGETQWGISERSYPKLNIRALTRPDAVAIYRRDFWQRVSGDQLPKAFAFQALSEAVADTIERDARAELRAEVAGALVQIGRDADDHVHACQAVIDADRNVGAGGIPARGAPLLDATNDGL